MTGPAAGSAAPSNSTANTGASFHRPRKARRSWVRSMAWGMANQARRGPSV